MGLIGIFWDKVLLYASLTGCCTSCLIPVPCWTNTDLVIRTHMPLSVFNMEAHCQSWSFMPHLSCHTTVFINNVTATLLCWLAKAHASLESCNSVYHPYFPVLLFSHVARQFGDFIQRLEFDKLIVLQQFFCIYLVFDSLTWGTLEPLVLAV